MMMHFTATALPRVQWYPNMGYLHLNMALEDWHVPVTRFESSHFTFTRHATNPRISRAISRVKTLKNGYPDHNFLRLAALSHAFFIYGAGRASSFVEGPFCMPEPDDFAFKSMIFGSKSIRERAIRALAPKTYAFHA